MSFLRPLVVLLGGSKGTWQTRAERALGRVAPAVQAVAGLPLAEAWLALDSADVIVAWCGQGADVHYLDDWILVGGVLQRQTRVVVGVDPATDHPMAPSLRQYAELCGVPCLASLDEVLDAAIERCREVRGR